MRVAVLGGGISGLSAAFFLKKNGMDVTVFEKEKRVGGWIESVEEDGFLWEEGPHSLRPTPVLWKLIQMLHLEKEVIFPKRDVYKRYLWYRGKLRAFPFFSSLSFPFVWGYMLSFLRGGKRTAEEGESAWDFFVRRYGKKWALLFGKAYVHGIYAGDVEKLAMQEAFPTKPHFAFPYPFFSFRKGVATLVHTLAKEVTIFFQEVKALYATPKGIKVVTSHKEEMFDRVITALPTYVLNKLIPSISCEIPFVSLYMVHVGIKHDIFPYSGFGYLLPEGKPLLGTIFTSNLFERSPHTQLTIMTKENPLFAVDKVLKEHLSLKKDPDIVRVIQKTAAIPQYEPGHAIKRKKYEQALKTFSPYLDGVGASLYGISVGDCILQSYLKCCGKKNF